MTKAAILAALNETRDILYLALREAEDGRFVQCADHLSEAVERLTRATGGQGKKAA